MAADLCSVRSPRIVSLSHAYGQQVFVAGMSGDRGSGIINVRDLGGKMILRAP